MSDTPGLALEVVSEWLDATLPGLRRGPLAAEVIAGGKSNLTYRVTDGTSTWALRRPPLGHVLPTAHDMGREYRVISGLAKTDVPVPFALALCENPAVLGAPFYLMSFVDGIVLDDAESLGQLTRSSAQGVCEHLVDTLAALHAVDAAAVGLGQLGRPEGFLARQVNRWHKQWRASETRPLDEVDRVVDTLNATMPRQTEAAIVHGDFKLANVIYRKDLSTIAAVIDWEMATLGDPLTDLALLAMYQQLGFAGACGMPRITAEAGFLDGLQLLERYAGRSHRDLGDIAWYLGFAYFKFAVVVEGIHNRYLQGKTLGEGFDNLGAEAPILLNTALDALPHR